MRETASPAASIESKAAEQRHDRLGLADDPQRHLGGDAERPLGADDDAEQVGPVVGVDRLAAELEQLAVGQDHLRARDVVDREAVLQAVRAAGVLRDVAADRADLLARRVGRVVVAVRRDGAGHVEVRDAGLDDDALALEVDLEDAVHAGERDHDPVRDRQRAAGEPGAGAARDERHALAGAEANHGLHLLGRARAARRTPAGAPPGQSVALVRRQLLRLRDHVLGADRLAQVVHELGGRGTRRSYSRPGSLTAPIDDRSGDRLGSS